MADQWIGKPAMLRSDIVAEEGPEVIAADDVTGFDQQEPNLRASAADCESAETSGQPTANNRQVHRLHAARHVAMQTQAGDPGLGPLMTNTPLGRQKAGMSGRMTGLAVLALLMGGAALPARAGGGAPTTAADLQVQLSGLRSAKGMVHLCLSSSSTRFLHCKDDPKAVARSVAAGSASRLDLGAVKAGTYALLVVHDENRNGRLDMTFGIPREGFGFSNNPAMKPRAPKWEEIRFTVPPSPSVQQVRVRYVL
jgi:uncharacterized protein (DUF2141 family)